MYRKKKKKKDYEWRLLTRQTRRELDILMREENCTQKFYLKITHRYTCTRGG